MRPPALTLFLSLLALLPAEALKLAGIFGDEMVLQRETAAPIWGWGAPGKEVRITASWDKTPVETSVTPDGSWHATLSTPQAGGPHTITVTCDGDTVTLSHVLTGDVWICSGQSNMQWKMRGFGPKHWEDEVQQADKPRIRYTNVPQVRALEPQSDLTTRWTTCTPQSVLNLSAVAYFFASHLHEELDVPIGLVSTNWGGSSAEAWISPGTLASDFPEFKPALNNYQSLREQGILFPNGDKSAPKGLNQRSPAVLSNAMIEPLLPLAIKGVIWYQGESNISRPRQYRTLFPALITDWRTRWNQGDFPFYYVQIAPFSYRREKLPAALLREAQLRALEVPNTGMAVTMDIGNATNIHPKKKKPVGRRLALLALDHTYGRDLVSSGPLYQKMDRHESAIRLAFTDTGSGLASLDGDDLAHFTIAGNDRIFHPATAEIDGHTLLVSSPEVKRPIAVRFGWGNADLTNFGNKEGLPAPSFRTDDWPIGN